MDLIIFDPLNRIIWAFVIFLYFFFGIYLIFRGLNRDEMIKRIYRMIGVLILGLALLRLFYYLSDYYIEGFYDGHIFIGNYDSFNELYYPIYIQLAHSSVNISINIFIYEIGRIIGISIKLNKKKYRIGKYLKFLSGLSILFIIISLFFIPFDIQRNLMVILAGIDTIIVMLFLWGTYKYRSPSQIQSSVSVMYMIGGILVLAGLFLDSRFVKEARILSSILPAFFLLIGLLILIIPTLFNSNKINRFSRYIKYFWYSLIASHLFMLIVSSLFFINIDIPIVFLIIFILGMFLYIYTIIICIKNIYKKFKIRHSNTTVIKFIKQGLYSFSHYFHPKDDKDLNEIEEISEEELKDTYLDILDLTKQEYYILTILDTLKQMQNEYNPVSKEILEKNILEINLENNISDKKLDSALKILRDKYLISRSFMKNYNITAAGIQFLQVIKSGKYFSIFDDYFTWKKSQRRYILPFLKYLKNYNKPVLVGDLRKGLDCHINTLLKTAYVLTENFMIIKYKRGREKLHEISEIGLNFLDRKENDFKD